MENIINSKTLLDATLRIINTRDVLDKKKVIGLYFSASYCPPCHIFTPILAQKYAAAKAVFEYRFENSTGALEIILVPSDKTQELFESYFSKMPWFSLPFNTTGADLRVTYGVKTIPTLIFFDETGKIIEKNGRALVEKCTTDELIERLSL